MFCINCGQPINHSSTFCRFCGTKYSEPMPQPQILNNNTTNSPPSYKPYGWASDSLSGKMPPQTPPAGKTQPIRQVQPLPQFPNQPQNLAQMPNYAPPANYQTQMLSGYRCPRCGTTAPPQFVRKISAAGWVVFAVLLITVFPLFWIGLLMKEDRRVCPVCLGEL